MLNTAHVVIVTVNSSDTYMCVEKMKQQLGPSRSAGNKCNLQLATGCAQQRGGERGLHGAERSGHCGGIVGFAVVYDNKYKAYIPTEAYPAIVLERLSKETSDIANGPCTCWKTWTCTSTTERR